MNILFKSLFTLILTTTLTANVPERITAFLAVDASDELKWGCLNDFDEMKQALAFVAHSSGLKIDLQAPNTRTLHMGLINNWVQNLKKTDIAIFYFSGHGCRQRSTIGQWPNLWLSKQQHLLVSTDLIAKIKRASPYFSIILLDCCNDHVSFRSKSAPLPYLYRQKNRAFTGIKNLFGKAKGMVIASASLPGKSAFGTDEGGYFTQIFIETLFQESARQDLTWHSFMRILKDEYRDVQTAQYEINVSGV